MTGKKVPVLERLQDKFLVDDGCWPWLASTCQGYGQFSVERRRTALERRAANRVG
jgi:hypothetical protein